ncbi:MAG: hypothetical protein Ct9H300mP11_16370 [Chloroflexota bacterium]|nr:MAG: hypothetical protein Ct9H300mP11_16370 [Chloroflexota bacterium]
MGIVIKRLPATLKLAAVAMIVAVAISFLSETYPQLKEIQFLIM